MESNIEEIENLVPETNEENESSPDLTETMKFMADIKKLKEIPEFRNTISKLHEGLIEPESGDIIDTFIKNTSLEALQAMTDEAIETLFLVNGEEISLNKGNTDKKREMEFRRDYITTRKGSFDLMENLDIEEARLNEAYKDHDEEIKEFMKKLDDGNRFLREQLQTSIDSTTNPELKKHHINILDAFDNAFSLDTVIEAYKKLDKGNQLGDYRRMPDTMYDKFIKKTKGIHLKVSIANFGHLEERFLSEKYHKNPDLFLFLIVKFICYRKNITRAWEGTFLTQLCINIQRMYSGKIEDEEKKQFCANIERLLELFE